jgi:hypothetical protein
LHRTFHVKPKHAIGAVLGVGGLVWVWFLVTVVA